MRLRNVKHAKQTINKHPEIVVFHPDRHRGLWAEIFGNHHPIHVEIGCGKGKFIVEKAAKYPDINFIGIEKYDSVIIRALEKIIDQPLKNLKLIRMDAEAIETIFDRAEVDSIYLNFSDPWPKKRTAKRRLTSPEYLKRYQNILKDQAKILLKTDNFKFYQYAMMSFNQNHRFKINDLTMDLYKHLPEDNVATEFEIKFVEEGKLIHFLEVIFKGEDR